MEQLISAAVLYKDKKGDREWFITKQETKSGWELPKFEVKPTESSVRTSIRSLLERNGIIIQVLEEAGRANISTTVNGQPIRKKILFYLMRQEGRELEAMSNPNENQVVKWLPYTAARRRLALTREQKILSQANRIAKRLIKEAKNKQE